MWLGADEGPGKTWKHTCAHVGEREEPPCRETAPWQFCIALPLRSSRCPISGVMVVQERILLGRE